MKTLTNITKYGLPIIGWCLLSQTTALMGDDKTPVPFVETFSAPSSTWTFEPAENADKEWLNWRPMDAQTGDEGGWHFHTAGRVSAYREWPVGTRPFVLDFEVELASGRDASWRLNGVSILISSKPVYQMETGDMGIAFTFMQSGVQASVKLGPISEFERRESATEAGPRAVNETYVSSNASPRGVLNRGGAGGHRASWPWPGLDLSDQQMRLRMERTADHYIRFTLYHSAGDPSEPVWEGVWQLPANHRLWNRESLNLRKVPLNYVNVLTTTNNAPGDTTPPRSTDTLRGSIKSLTGITAPGTLPSVQRYDGAVAEGNLLTLHGEGFQEGAVALINGARTPTRWISESKIQIALQGISEAADLNLALGNPDGGVTFFPHPIRAGSVVEAVIPAELRQSGDEIITLKGRGFTPTTRIAIGEKEAKIVERVSATELKIRTPAGALGRVDVQVTDGDTLFEVKPTVAYAAHPYLLIQPEDVATLRQRFNAPHMRHYREMILRLADRSADPARLTARQMVAPDYGENIWATVWAYLLTGEQKYKDSAIIWIQGTTGPNDVLRSLDPSLSEERRQAFASQFGITDAAPDISNPGILIQNLAMHQFQIQRGTAIAIAYDILFDELDPALRGRMLDYMNNQLDLAITLVKANDWWYANNPSNTVAVANGAIGLMALSHMTIRDDIAEIAQLTSDTIKKNFKAIEEDGGSPEGTLYWNYGFGAQINLGIALENTLNDDFGLLSDPRLELGVDFAQVALAGDGNMFVFNDSQPWLNGTVPAALGASRFDQPFMRWLVDEIMERYSQEERIVTEVVRPTYTIPAFLMRGDAPPVEKMPPLPTLLTMDRIHWGVMRSTSDAHKQGVVVGIKGLGGVRTHHLHYDQGHYVLHAHGREFFLDSGYHKREPYLHAVPIPFKAGEDLRQANSLPGMDRSAEAPLVRAWEQGPIRTITVDATLAYSGKNHQRADKVHRVFVLVGDEAMILLDDVRPTEGTLVLAQFQSAQAPILGEDTRSFRVERDGAQVGVHLFGPKLDKVEYEPYDISKGGWIYRQMGADWNRIFGSYAANPDQPLVTIFQPTPDLTPTAPPRVTYQGNQIRVNLPSGQALTFERIDGNWILKKP